MEELILPDVYDVWFTSFWQTLPGYGTLCILALGVFCLGYVIIRTIRIYRRGTSKDEALRKLRALAGRASKGHLELRKVYQELTDIVKSYAQWRYSLPRGMTDYELVSGLQEVGCQDAVRATIERIIIDAQAVKFGQLDAPKEQVLHDIALTTSFIEVAGERNS
jgi:hypothetical protein